MGIMVGGNTGGTRTGMAPGAQWIAAKVFNDAGTSSSSAIHASLEWVLDPDGNPGTDDAPDVVNNSWTLAIPGCYSDFQADLQALRAAEITPVFSAGNAGPGANSSRSPANLPEALSVGAVDEADQIAWFSSRGPSACAGDLQFPDLVAPGVAIKTADLFGLFQSAEGTSFSAPHVAGALALLLSAHPELTVTHQEAALFGSVVDLGSAGPDSTYGRGRLDVEAALAWLDAGGQDPGGPPTTTTTTTTSTTTSSTTTSTTTTSTTTSTTTTTTLPPGNQSPTAAFSVSKRKDVYTFDGSASSDPDGSIVSWSWNFGDDSTGSGETVTHTFPGSGTFTITLTVTDDEGASASSSQDVRVGNGGGGRGKK
jgi:subtilisin family serine protease